VPAGNRGFLPFSPHTALAVKIVNTAIKVIRKTFI
jgi:hypothetical protein